VFRGVYKRKTQPLKARAFFVFRCALRAAPQGEGAPAPLYSRGGRKQNKQKQPMTYVLYLARIELLYTYDDVIF
jgi:hypothetical protein